MVTKFVFVVYRTVIKSSGIIGNSLHKFPNPPSLKEIIGAIEDTIKKETGEDPKEIIIINLQFFDEESYKILSS